MITNQIVGSRVDRDTFETLAYTDVSELDAATIEEYRAQGYDYLEIQNRANEDDDYDILDSWSDDGSEALSEDDDSEDGDEAEPCIVCGDDSTDWLPVWNGGKWWQRNGTAHHCGCHEEHEVIAAYRKALDEVAQEAGYADADDMNDPDPEL